MYTHFYNRGIRYITLTHSKDNQICDSSYDDKMYVERPGAHLAVEVVRRNESKWECNGGYFSCF